MGLRSPSQQPRFVTNGTPEFASEDRIFSGEVRIFQVGFETLDSVTLSRPMLVVCFDLNTDAMESTCECRRAVYLADRLF